MTNVEKYDREKDSALAAMLAELRETPSKRTESTPYVIVFQAGKDIFFDADVGDVAVKQLVERHFGLFTYQLHIEDSHILMAGLATGPTASLGVKALRDERRRRFHAMYN